MSIFHSTDFMGEKYVTLQRRSLLGFCLMDFAKFGGTARKE